MCYEFSNWFQKARAKELHRARDTMERAKAQPPVQAPEKQSDARPAETVPREKVPA